MPKAKVPRRRVKALAKRDVLSLLMAARSKRDPAIVYMAYVTGLRLSELTALDVGDVNLEERSVHIRRGKGWRERYVFMDETCEVLLRQYLAPRGHYGREEPLFLTRSGKRMSPNRISTIVRELALRGGLIGPEDRYRVTTHKLRHTFASIMLDQVGIFGPKELLGHESIATTERYLHADLEDLRRSYDRGSGALALTEDRLEERATRNIRSMGGDVH